MCPEPYPSAAQPRTEAGHRCHCRRSRQTSASPLGWEVVVRAVQMSPRTQAPRQKGWHREASQSATSLLTDDDEPCGENRTLWSSPTSASGRWWWRVGWWRRSRTPLRLEEIRVVRLRINGDRLRARERVHSRNHRVLVSRVLMDDRDVALGPIRDVDQFFRGIPSQGINARAVRDGRHDFARARVNDHGGRVAARENAVRGLVVGDACRPFAWRERPRSGRLPRLYVDDLNRVLAFIVDEDVSFAVGGSALRRRVFELDSGDNVTALRIDRGERSDRTAVIGQDDLVVGLVVHDAVQ